MSTALPCGHDPSRYAGEMRRCKRKADQLMVLEIVQSTLAIGTLLVVALCGIVAITHTAVASGAVALPLGLGLAMSVAMAMLGFAFHSRLGRESARRELFGLQYARRQMRGGDRQPYRTAPNVTQASCAFCVVEDLRRHA